MKNFTKKTYNVSPGLYCFYSQVNIVISGHWPFWTILPPTLSPDVPNLEVSVVPQPRSLLLPPLAWLSARPLLLRAWFSPDAPPELESPEQLVSPVCPEDVGGSNGGSVQNVGGSITGGPGVVWFRIIYNAVYSWSKSKTGSSALELPWAQLSERRRSQFNRPTQVPNPLHESLVSFQQS